MAGLDRHQLARAAFHLGPVVHLDLHPARLAVSEVPHLTGVGARDRRQVDRPFPAGLELAPDDRAPRELQDVRLAVTFELADLVRRVEALALNARLSSRHRCSFRYAQPIPWCNAEASAEDERS